MTDYNASPLFHDVTVLVGKVDDIYRRLRELHAEVTTISLANAKLRLRTTGLEDRVKQIGEDVEALGRYPALRFWADGGSLAA